MTAWEQDVNPSCICITTLPSLFHPPSSHFFLPDLFCHCLSTPYSTIFPFQHPIDRPLLLISSSTPEARPLSWVTLPHVEVLTCRLPLNVQGAGQGPFLFVFIDFTFTSPS